MKKNVMLPNYVFCINTCTKVLIFLKKKSTFATLKRIISMKPEIHPENYRLVVFKDMSNEDAFVTKSTVDTKETIVWEDGNEYPLFKLEISNTSHPFYTGKSNLIDTAGRIDKFNKRYGKK